MNVLGDIFTLAFRQLLTLIKCFQDKGFLVRKNDAQAHANVSNMAASMLNHSDL